MFFFCVFLLLMRLFIAASVYSVLSDMFNFEHLCENEM